MLCPITVPSRIFSAANSVVVPWRLSSCVMVPARPGCIGSPGWVRSSAWTWLFSSGREDDRMGARVDIEADDILEFFGELRIVRRWSGCRFLDRPTQQQGQKAQPLRILVLGEFCCIEPSISI
jgi:hypothetical protein